MTDFIKVKATNSENKVALWDRDDRHPNGEVFVSGDGKTVEVANTATVRNAIRSGALVEVQPEVAKAPVKQEAPLSGKTTLVMDGVDSVVLENDPTTAPLSYVELVQLAPLSGKKGRRRPSAKGA